MVHMVLVLVLVVMSNSGFKDEVLIKLILIVGVVKHHHVTINELGLTHPVDNRGSNRFL
jgi:hypothetical protein